jgi:hypothetical protein
MGGDETERNYRQVQRIVMPFRDDLIDLMEKD